MDCACFLVLLSLSSLIKIIKERRLSSQNQLAIDGVTMSFINLQYFEILMWDFCFLTKIIELLYLIRWRNYFRFNKMANLFKKKMANLLVSFENLQLNFSLDG